MMYIALGLIVLLLIWCILLSLFFWQLYNHYNTLIKGTDKKKLQEILEDILSTMHANKSDIAILRKAYDNISKDNRYHIQKIGLRRFNPFNDTGGDQSFIVSFLDANDTGVIISGLYSRSGTRWYAKQVIEGKGVEHELSDEEKKALQTATFTRK